MNVYLVQVTLDPLIEPFSYHYRHREESLRDRVVRYRASEHPNASTLARAPMFRRNMRETFRDWTDIGPIVKVFFIDSSVRVNLGRLAEILTEDASRGEAIKRGEKAGRQG
jgi:hypothetical protein